MIEVINKTLDYNINKCQKARFKDKTCGEVRKEGLTTDKPITYLIKPNEKIKEYWADIETKKRRQVKNHCLCSNIRKTISVMIT